MLDPRPAFADRIEDLSRAGAVGDIRRREVHHEQAAVGIDGDVALATDELLGAVVTTGGSRRRCLDGLSCSHP